MQHIIAYLTKIDGHDMFGIDTIRQLTDMIPKRADMGTVEEGMGFIETTIMPVIIGHICPVRNESHIIERGRSGSIAR